LVDEVVLTLLVLRVRGVLVTFEDEAAGVGLGAGAAAKARPERVRPATRVRAEKVLANMAGSVGMVLAA
jgi:hypothetical protein